MSWIKLNSGIKYDFINPTVDMVSLGDITHNLSKEQRFSNCLDNDWSVLQHVLLVALMVEEDGGTNEEIFLALHHDDPEAYFRDVPTPLKELLPHYNRFYEVTSRVIEEKFNLSNLQNLPSIVKKWDKLIMFVEDLNFSFHESDWHAFDDKKYSSLNDEFNGRLSRYIDKLLDCSREQLKLWYLNKHNHLKHNLK